jgi:hypothetical protein
LSPNPPSCKPVASTTASAPLIINEYPSEFIGAIVIPFNVEPSNCADELITPTAFILFNIVLSIELLNPANLASLLLIDVLIEELIEIIFASDALNEVATEELKFVIVVEIVPLNVVCPASDALNDVNIEELRLSIVVSNDELKFVIVVAIDALNTVCPASDALNEVTIEELKFVIVVFIEELIE